MTKRRYWEKLRFLSSEAAKGRGFPLPFTGKGWMKQRIYTSLKNPDEGPHNWRIFWRSKNLTKLNNRDDRRMGDEGRNPRADE